MQHKSSFQVVIVSTIEDKARFNHAWHSTWLEEGYAVAADNILKKYAQYDPFSVDYLLLNTKNEVAGTMRIINQNDSVGLPVLNDFDVDRFFDRGEKLCEVTLLTIKQTERKYHHLPTFLLFSELRRYVNESNISGILIASDIRLWSMLNHKFGLSFTEIGQRKMYEGSLTVPGYLNVKGLNEQNLIRTLRDVLK